jgi:ubiquinone/menaquinone biosynthesis C-methylase UbiE
LEATDTFGWYSVVCHIKESNAMDLDRYRNSDLEKARASDLMRILPRGRGSVLDIGAFDGYYSRLLAEHFSSVTALDLREPSFECPGVTTVAGDVTQLQFGENSFDCVFCAEVLEHIPDVERAAREVCRVARHEVIIGVPYKQDIRFGRTTCLSCGKINPPWGHVNKFDEDRLRLLFAGLRMVSRSFVGRNNEATNWLSTWLMDRAGNPWGAYNREWPCIYCNGPVGYTPEKRPFRSKLCSAVAVRINLIQQRFTRHHANWIHMVFSKDRW